MDVLKYLLFLSADVSFCTRAKTLLCLGSILVIRQSYYNFVSQLLAPEVSSKIKSDYNRRTSFTAQGYLNSGSSCDPGPRFG